MRYTKSTLLYFVSSQTGLAVGDVKEIQEEAELKRISLKVVTEWCRREPLF